MEDVIIDLCVVNVVKIVRRKIFMEDGGLKRRLGVLLRILYLSSGCERLYTSLGFYYSPMMVSSTKML